MVWRIPEELRKELAGLGSVRPYASKGYMSKGAYRTHATYNRTQSRKAVLARDLTSEQRYLVISPAAQFPF